MKIGPWPELPRDAWLDTRDMLHRYAQVIGKIRLTLTPLVNHWWNVPLYVSPRGLTTSLIPYRDRSFDMDLDFIAHRLRISTSKGEAKDIPLAQRNVADFHREVFARLRELRIDCAIWTMPVELENPIPFERDDQLRTYDPEYAHRFSQVLLATHAALTQFRSRFIGKCSPVHFFWGSFDLAVTRFSGRRAPPKDGLDSINREAYSHEVSSVGWWPGDERLPKPAFYSYAAPEPAGFRARAMKPAAAYYHEKLGGFYLHYDDVRTTPDPEATFLEFAESTYAAAADLAQWNRAELERT